MSDNLPTLTRPTIRPIVPATMDEAWRLASAIHKSRMAPPGYTTQEAITVAILHGLELGLTPLAALQSIAVINGRPTIYGDGLMAIVRGSGICRYIREYDNGKAGDDYAAICETHRVGEDQPVARPFFVRDAKEAGLWSKAGPWKQYPKRMLAARARSFCLRDVYADVLRGIVPREEVEDYQMRDVTPEPEKPALARRAPPAPDPDEEAREPEIRASEAPDVEEVAFDPDDILAQLDEGLAVASTVEDCRELWNGLDVLAALTGYPDMLAMAEMMMDRRIKRLSKEAKR